MQRSMLFLATLGVAFTLPAQAPFVVHEWGTFTSIQGSDGVTLLGAHHEEELLPAFVHEISPLAAAAVRVKGIGAPMLGVTQKMETPVLYFHGGQARKVTVEVGFTKGLISQWFPGVAAQAPVLGGLGGKPFDLRKIDTSMLRWECEILPRAQGVPSGLPRVRPDEPWSFAREVAADYVRAQGETEQYLFYRGVGRFELPVHVEAMRLGAGTLHNRGSLAIPAVIALEVAADGARFRQLPAVAPGKAGGFDLGVVPKRPVPVVQQELQACVQALLVAQGLHADEARAMVRTWARSWFHKRGTRVFYVVPREETDRLLPLVITPRPDAVVRVLVGRIDYLTPEAEASLLQAVADIDSGEEGRVAAGNRVLGEFDRFAEAALHRAHALTDSVRMRARIERMLTDLP